MRRAPLAARPWRAEGRRSWWPLRGCADAGGRREWARSEKRRLVTARRPCAKRPKPAADKLTQRRRRRAVATISLSVSHFLTKNGEEVRGVSKNVFRRQRLKSRVSSDSSSTQDSRGPDRSLSLTVAGCQNRRAT